MHQGLSLQHEHHSSDIASSCTEAPADRYSPGKTRVGTPINKPLAPKLLAHHKLSHSPPTVRRTHVTKYVEAKRLRILPVCPVS